MRLTTAAVTLAALSSLTACSPDAVSEDGRTIIVAPGLNGEWDSPELNDDQLYDITGTIQAAVDLANPGDVIEVQGGDFYEDVNITVDDITLDGAGIYQTNLYGKITVDGTNIDDFALTQFSVTNQALDRTGYGIDVTNGARVSITQTSVGGWDRGIHLNDADNSYIARNNINLNKHGVWADYTDNATYVNNLVQSNDVAGITNYFGDGGHVAYNTLIGNAFQASSVTGFGGALQFGSSTETESVLNNIVVSNFFGINCQGCDNSFSSNLVWGNFTNYSNDASQQSDDVSIDPRMADPGNFDFRLTAESPAIDAANSTFGVTDDFYGSSRPSGAGNDLGFAEFSQSGFDLIITEVMANAQVETVHEFVEIYNNGSTAVDLDGLVLTDGDEEDSLTPFGSGTTIVQPGEYAVVVDTDYDGLYDIDVARTVVTTQDTEVGNGLTTADRVTLKETDGTVISTYSYPDDPGDGVSMEMVLLAQGDAAGNWRASQCTGGSSPGEAPCFPPSGDPAGLVITEVLFNAETESTGEYIELWNSSNLEIDAAGLVFSDGNGSDTLAGFADSGTLIAPGEHALILDSGFEFQYALPNGIRLLTTDDGSALGSGGLANTGESITLFQADGTTVISTFGSSFSPTDAGNGVSWSRIDYSTAGTTDAASDWTEGDTNCTTGITPGRLNQPAGGICSPLVINEVMANAINEDRHEFIELFNAGLDAVDVSTLTIRDNIQIDTLQAYSGGSTMLGSGEYAVILDAEYDDAQYDIPSGALLLTTGDTSLGNSLGVNDEISLWIGDSRLDIYNFPFNPGNGISAEQIGVWNSDAAANWTASTCATGSSPGQANCATGGTAGGSGTSLYELVLTEVMANADDEDTDEFIEIYNWGSAPIDVSLFTVWDGDQIDTIHDFYGGTGTVVAPGEYAVIIDAEYDIIGDKYGLSSAPILLTTSDTTIGSGLSTSEAVYLFEPDGLTLIDSYTHPANPGNATSREKADPLGGDIGSNWVDTSCNGGNTAGAASCP